MLKTNETIKTINVEIKELDRKEEVQKRVQAEQAQQVAESMRKIEQEQRIKAENDKKLVEQKYIEVQNQAEATIKKQ